MTTTIIHGCIIIGSDNVTITGFTIWGCGPAGVEIDGFSNNIIENCIFNYTYIGVQLLEKSNNNIIRNCSFRRCEFVSLQIRASNNNEISYCDFFDNLGDLGFPAAIFIRTSRGIKIDHCNITRNYPCGVWLRFSDIQLTSNNIFNNSGPGLEIFGAFSFCDSRYNWWGTPQGPNISTLIHLLTLGLLR